MEIRADGQLDYPDELLATFDLVVASLHVSRRQPRGRADPARPERDREPTRRRDRAPVGPDDRHARRPRPRLGHRLFRSRGANRHRPGDERLAPSAGPVGRAGAAGARRRLPPVDRLGCPPHARVLVPGLGHLPGAPGMGGAAPRAEHALACRPPRVARRQAGGVSAGAHWPLAARTSPGGAISASRRSRSWACRG